MVASPGAPLLPLSSPVASVAGLASPKAEVAASPGGPLSPALRGLLQDKLALVAKLGYLQNRSGLISNNGGSLLSNHGAGLISNHGAGLISNNGGAYRQAGALRRLAQAVVPEVVLSQSPKLGRPEGVESLLEKRLWVAGGGWLRFGIGAVGERSVTLHPQGLWAQREVEEVALERFGDGKLKRTASAETLLADDGTLRLQRQDRLSYEEGTGLGLAYELGDAPLKVRYAELDFAQDVALYRLDRSTGTGAFKFRFPKTQHTEEGTLSEVGLGADQKLFIGLGDALSSYPGEAEVKDAQGQRLYLKKRWLQGGVVTRSYDFGEGLVITLAKSGEYEGKGQVGLNGQDIGTAKLTIHPNGSHVFEVQVAQEAVQVVGYGNLDAPATPTAPVAPPAAWEVQRVLGDGLGDASGDALTARFKGLRGIVAHPTLAKRWYAADHGAHRVVQIDLGATWTVSPLAGTGSPGDTNGPAGSSPLRGPWGLAFGPEGSLYVSEADANRIRRIRFAAEGPLLESVAGGSPVGAWVDAAGAAARFKAPFALACLGTKLYVADWGNHRIRRVDLNDPSFPVATVAGNGQASTLDGSVANAGLQGPVGLLAQGDKLVVATYNTLREVDLVAGQVRTLGGTAGQAPSAPNFFTDGPAGAAGFYPASALGAFGAEGWLVGAVDLRLVAPDGSIRTLAGRARYGSRDGEHDEALFNRIYGIAPAGPNSYLVTEGQDSEESSSPANSRLRLIRLRPAP